MIAPLPVLRLVIDDFVFDLHLPDAEIALEVGGIVLGVPETELNQGKGRNRSRREPVVAQSKLPDFECLIERHKIARTGRDAAILRAYGRVTHAVPARVLLQIAAGGHPGWRPVFPALVVTQVDVTPAVIQRNVVIPPACDASQTRISIKRITTGSIGNNAEVRLASEIIDPRQWRIWLSDYIFPVPIVKIAVLHDNVSNEIRTSALKQRRAGRARPLQ